MKLNKYILFFLLLSAICCNSNLFSKNTKDYIRNSNFSSGNVDFFSEYKYSPGNLKPSRVYTITKNAKLEYSKFDSCKDHTTGDGNYMIVNGSDSANKIVWKQTVNNLELFQTYTLKLWLMSIDTLNPAILAFFINGREIPFSPVYIPKTACQWNEFSFNWNSNNFDSAEIVIKDVSLKFYGNDFGIDDISFLSACVVDAEAGPAKYLCKGQSTKIGESATGNIPPLKFDWSPKTGLSAYDVLQPDAFPTTNTLYYLTVTDSVGCMAFDTVSVNIVPFPETGISADKSTLICPCDSILLTAPDGFSWNWTTGEKTRSIFVKNAGIYSVDTYNSFGCKSTSDITIKLPDYYTKFILGKINANVGQTIRLPLTIETKTNKDICNDLEVNADLVFNSTLMNLITPNLSVIKEGNNGVLKIRNMSIDSLLDLEFFVTLGNDSCTNLTIRNSNYVCSNLPIQSEIGRLCLANICTEPVNRLFLDQGATAITGVNPNPFWEFCEISILVGSEENHELYLLNPLGQRIQNISGNINTPGEYKFNISRENLSYGIYYLVLKSKTIFLTQKLIVF